ncbi:MAG: PEP-CTERM sorting domain-containing protein, partial [Fimbriimonadales bacterium]|nr:PEP-CTERM sorting domain-containing protein [Fimbriimonadales bacterium]
PPPVWPPRLGESHFLSKDSGGPSIQSDGMGNWLLVGIHTAGEHGANYTFVQEGMGWADVRVGSYLNWINAACQQAIPEPASITALSAGLLLLTISRLRRKQPG